MEPARGRLALGRLAQGQDAPDSTRADRIPARYDLSIPENQRKLDVVEELAQVAERGRD